MAVSNEPSKKGNQTISLIKDVFALVRDMIIFLIFISLILFPVQLNNVLTKAGFEEGSLAGFKWKSGLAKSNQALQDAQTTIHILSAQLDSVTNLLSKINPQIKDTSLKNDIASVEKQKIKIDSIYTQTNNTVRKVISSNAQLVSDAQKQLNPDGQWGIVFAADLDIDKARYERDVAAKKYQIPNVFIFFRQGYYRTVSIVDTREEAQTVLLKARNRRKDAYIVTLSSWCPNADEKDGYKSCVSK